MISVNLLPAEYRKSESTPIARFLAIVLGAVVVTSGLVAYGYVHYSQLSGVVEVRKATEAEYSNAKARADISKSLKTEHEAYEARRKAIQGIAKARILRSRKLDEFLDIMSNPKDPAQYRVWLSDLKVKPARVVRRGKSQDGGNVAFSGHTESQDFTRVTNLRDAIKSHAYFEDFRSISRPGFKSVQWDDGLEPDRAGKFSFNLTYKPLGWRHQLKKKR